MGIIVLAGEGNLGLNLLLFGGTTGQIRCCMRSGESQWQQAKAEGQ